MKRPFDLPDCCDEQSCAWAGTSRRHLHGAMGSARRSLCGRTKNLIFQSNVGPAPPACNPHGDRWPKVPGPRGFSETMPSEKKHHQQGGLTVDPTQRPVRTGGRFSHPLIRVISGRPRGGQIRSNPSKVAGVPDGERKPEAAAPDGEPPQKTAWEPVGADNCEAAGKESSGAIEPAPQGAATGSVKVSPGAAPPPRPPQCLPDRSRALRGPPAATRPSQAVADLH